MKIWRQTKDTATVFAIKFPLRVINTIFIFIIDVKIIVIIITAAASTTAAVYTSNAIFYATIWVV